MSRSRGSGSSEDLDQTWGGLKIHRFGSGSAVDRAVFSLRRDCDDLELGSVSGSFFGMCGGVALAER